MIEIKNHVLKILVHGLWFAAWHQLNERRVHYDTVWGYKSQGHSFCAPSLGFRSQPASGCRTEAVSALVCAWVCERMATLVDPVDSPASFGGASSIRTTASPSTSTQHFDDSKYYLLVVIGELVTDEHLKCAIADIEKGSCVVFACLDVPRNCACGYLDCVWQN